MKQKEKQGMNNYIGQYRVRTPISASGEFTDNLDDTYIKGKSGVEVYRYNDTILAVYFPTPQLCSSKFEQIHTYLTPESKEQVLTDKEQKEFSGEQILYFPEDNFEKIAPWLHLETLGKNISPRSIRNLPRDKQKYLPFDEENYIVLKDMVSSIVQGYLLDHQLKHTPIYYTKIYQYTMDEMNIKDIIPSKILVYLDENKLLKNAIEIVEKLSKNTKLINQILCENNNVVDFADVINK